MALLSGTRLTDRIDRLFPREEAFRSALRGPDVASRVGLWLGLCFLVTLLTGVFSHFAQQASHSVPTPGPARLALPGHPDPAHRGRHSRRAAAAGEDVGVLTLKPFARLSAAAPGRGPARPRTALHCCARRERDLPAGHGSGQRRAVVPVGVVFPFDALRGRVGGRRRVARPRRGEAADHPPALGRVAAAGRPPGASREDAGPGDVAGRRRRGRGPAPRRSAGAAPHRVARGRSGDGPGGVPINKPRERRRASATRTQTGASPLCRCAGREARLSRAELRALPQRALNCRSPASRDGAPSGAGPASGCGPPRPRRRAGRVGRPWWRSLQPARSLRRDERCPAEVAADRTPLALELGGGAPVLDHGYPARMIAPGPAGSPADQVGRPARGTGVTGQSHGAPPGWSSASRASPPRYGPTAAGAGHRKPVATLPGRSAEWSAHDQSWRRWSWPSSTSLPAARPGRRRPPSRSRPRYGHRRCGPGARPARRGPITPRLIASTSPGGAALAGLFVAGGNSRPGDR